MGENKPNYSQNNALTNSYRYAAIVFSLLNSLDFMAIFNPYIKISSNVVMGWHPQECHPNYYITPTIGKEPHLGTVILSISIPSLSAWFPLYPEIPYASMNIISILAHSARVVFPLGSRRKLLSPFGLPVIICFSTAHFR